MGLKRALDYQTGASRISVQVGLNLGSRFAYFVKNRGGRGALISDLNLDKNWFAKAVLNRYFSQVLLLKINKLSRL